ncbi:putative ubiquitin-conjugating enzyme E2 2 isoform X2, partial [Capsicum annuum]
MGCATSKPKLYHKCQAPCSPVRQSYSMQDDSGYHMVALTSSTLGSLKLDPLNHSQSIKDDRSSLFEHVDFDEVKICKEDFAMGLIKAKTWLEMINEKIPKVVLTNKRRCNSTKEGVTLFSYSEFAMVFGFGFLSSFDELK